MSATKANSEHGPFDDLVAAVNRPREVWDCEKEELAVGTVIETGEVTTEYGSSPTVTLLVPDKSRELVVNGYGAVLPRHLRKVRCGDLLAIRFLGMRTPRHGGANYKDYKVVHTHGDGSPVEAQTEITDEFGIEPGEVELEPGDDFGDEPF
jgi:hypothetical protein